MKAWQILKETVNKWLADKAPMHGAALAFYSLLSMGPLLLIAVAVAGLWFGEDAARGHIVSQIEGLVGRPGAEVIQTLLANSSDKSSGIMAAMIGVATLLLGASGVFVQLQDSLNLIWKAPPPPKQSIWNTVTNRLLSMTMVLGLGFMLMVSLVASAVLNAMGTYFVGKLPNLAPLLEVVNVFVTFGVLTLLFAMIYKILPDVKTSWRNVWSGALLSASLFSIGKILIGIYLGQSTLSSTYGASGSLIVLALWVYYSAQIVFFGAELTYIVTHEKQKSSV